MLKVVQQALDVGRPSVLRNVRGVPHAHDLPLRAAGEDLSWPRRRSAPLSSELCSPRTAHRNKHLHFVYTLRMASPDTTTVRVRRPDSERLQSLAKARQTPVIDVLHAAIDALERQEFLRGLSEDYQHLRNDPERWRQYLAERQEWDALA